MRKVYLVLLGGLLLSCSPVERDYYKTYFDNRVFILDSVTNDFGPTTIMGEDTISFVDDIMTTKNSIGNISVSSYNVSHDTLYIGSYQSFKIIFADDGRIIYKYHKPIQTGSNTWSYTYYLTRAHEVINVPSDPIGNDPIPTE